MEYEIKERVHFGFQEIMLNAVVLFFIKILHIVFLLNEVMTLFGIHIAYINIKNKL